MADAQEQIIRSPYPDLLLEMIVVRMATLAPVLDADELLRALGTRATARAPEPEPPAGTRRLRVEGEVKADAPLRATGAPALVSASRASSTATASNAPAAGPMPLAPPAARAATAPVGSDLPELRAHIRARRAALAGFMEQGASLALDGDLLRVIPRNDIYIRYLNDNRASIGELATEFYGRKLRVEVSLNGAAGAAAPAAPLRPADAPGVSTGASSAPDAEPAESRTGDGATPGVALAPARDSAPAFAAAAAENPPPQPRSSIAADRQALYADPVVRRIFEELQGRLVEVRERPAAASAPPAEAPTAHGVSASNDLAPPAIRRPSQE
jgi:hypothetical protein